MARGFTQTNWLDKKNKHKKPKIFLTWNHPPTPCLNTEITGVPNSYAENVTCFILDVNSTVFCVIPIWIGILPLLFYFIFIFWPHFNANQKIERQKEFFLFFLMFQARLFQIRSVQTEPEIVNAICQVYSGCKPQSNILSARPGSLRAEVNSLTRVCL